MFACNIQVEVVYYLCSRNALAATVLYNSKAAKAMRLLLLPTDASVSSVRKDKPHDTLQVV